MLARNTMISRTRHLSSSTSQSIRHRLKTAVKYNITGTMEEVHIEYCENPRNHTNNSPGIGQGCRLNRHEGTDLECSIVEIKVLEVDRLEF